MKLKKVLAAVAATAVALSTMAVSAFAADIWTGSNPLGTDWNGENALKIEGSLFADMKGGDTVEISYTTDEDSGCCLKIVENTNGWPTLDSPEGMDPEWSTIAVESGSTSYSFVISAEDAARIQNSGMIVQGVGVTITKVAVDGAGSAEAEAPAEPEASAEPDEEATDEAEASAEPEAPAAPAETEASAAGGESTAPATGNVPAAVMVSVMAAAGVAAVASKKRK